MTSITTSACVSTWRRQQINPYVDMDAMSTQTRSHAEENLARTRHHACALAHQCVPITDAVIMRDRQPRRHVIPHVDVPGSDPRTLHTGTHGRLWRQRCAHRAPANHVGLSARRTGANTGATAPRMTPLSRHAPAHSTSVAMIPRSSNQCSWDASRPNEA